MVHYLRKRLLLDLLRKSYHERPKETVIMGNNSAMISLWVQQYHCNILSLIYFHISITFSEYVYLGVVNMRVCPSSRWSFGYVYINNYNKWLRSVSHTNSSTGAVPFFLALDVDIRLVIALIISRVVSTKYIFPSSETNCSFYSSLFSYSIHLGTKFLVDRFLINPLD